MDYSSEVVRRFKAAAAPRELSTGAAVAEADGRARIVAAEAEDRTLNVWVRFEVEVSQGIIREAAFQVFGCPHTVAAASWVADALRGKSVDNLADFDVQQVRRALEVPTEKLGKLLRIEDAVVGCREQLGRAGAAIPAAGVTAAGAAAR
jgi:NifU-like protein involved in Fe-S cluster formation